MAGFWFDRLIAGSGLRECVRKLGRLGSCEGPGGEPLSHNSSLYFAFSFYKVGVLKRFNPTFRPDKKSHSYWKGGYNTVSGASRLLPTLTPPSQKSVGRWEGTIIVYYSFSSADEQGRCGTWSWSGSPLNTSLELLSMGLPLTEAILTRVPFLTAVCVSDEWLTQIK